MEGLLTFLAVTLATMIDPLTLAAAAGIGAVAAARPHREWRVSVVAVGVAAIMAASAFLVYKLARFDGVPFRFSWAVHGTAATAQILAALWMFDRWRGRREAGASRVDPPKAEIDRRLATETTAELTQFVAILRGYDLREVALVAALAADAFGMLKAYGVDLSSPQAVFSKRPELPALLVQWIIELNGKGKPFLVPGLLVWCYTLRAEQFPDLRHLAKEMWALLERGFDEAEEAAWDFEQVTGSRLQPHMLFVPEGYRLGA